MATLRYRPEIDGLRAIAVVTVILFHANLLFEGGYVGVDVFFVISGFLITSLIVRDLENGQFSFSQFWERRVRRIFPPLILMVAVVGIAGYFLLLPNDLIALGKSMVSQSLLIANFFFYQNSGYFGGNAEEMPLLHTWSLAVEEQFYLLLPIVLFLAAFLKVQRKLIILFAILALIASFTFSAYAVQRSPWGAFFLLPSRAWELGLGSVFALLNWDRIQNNRLTREILGWSGLLGICLPAYFYTKNTPFPGPAALAPCLGTLLIILASNPTSDPHHRRSTLETLLSSRPMVFVGNISYSLYLWHWPLFAFASYYSFGHISLAYRLLALGLSFFLAYVSWRWVEQPFRKKRWCAKRRAILAFGAVSSLVLLLLGLTASLNHGFPDRISEEARNYELGAQDVAPHYQLTTEDVRSANFIALGEKNDGPVSLFVWGDSHAMAALPAFEKLCKQSDIRGQAATHSQTPPVLNFIPHGPNGLGSDAPEYNEAVLEHIIQKKISHTFIVGRWKLHSLQPEFRSAMLDTVKRLKDGGSEPVILLQVPEPGINVPRALAKQTLRGDRQISLPAEHNTGSGMDDLFLEELRRIGAIILDPTASFRSQDGILLELSGRPLYSDDHHLSIGGAELVLYPFIHNALEEFLPEIGNGFSVPGS